MVSVSLGTDPKGSFTLEQLREYAAALGFKDSSLAGKLTATQQSDMWAKLKRFALQNRRWYQHSNNTVIKLTDEMIRAMSERSRPWVFGAPQKSVAQKEKKHSTSHTIALHPWGLTAQYDAAEAKRRAEQLKADLSSWQFDAPSFEVWASMLMYDESVKGGGGGERFQRMLHFLLVDGRYGGTTTYENLYILPNGTSPHMSMVSPQDDTYWDSGSSQYVYISQNSRAWDGAKGGRIGYNLQHTGSSEDNAKGITSLVGHGESHEVNVSVRPGSKADWLKKMAVDIGRYNVQGTAVNQQFSRGVAVGKSNMPQEITGEMAMGNRLAMICGLYYYKGCDRPEYNWIVSHTVEGSVFYVRMRLPNPSYTIEGKKLKPQEPVNQPVLKQMSGIGTAHESTVVGAGNTSVPHMHEPQERPSLFLDHFLSQHKGQLVTTVAPFFGADTQGLPFRSTKAAADRAYLMQLHTQLGEVVHKPEAKQGLFLGFKSPKALWLYPHYADDSDTLQLVSKRGATPGYQPLLQWRSRYADGKWRDTLSEQTYWIDVFEAPGLNLDLLAQKEVDEAEERQLRMFALGKTGQSQYVSASNEPGSSVSASVSAAPEESTEVGGDLDDLAATEQRPDLPEPDVMRDSDDLVGAG